MFLKLMLKLAWGNPQCSSSRPQLMWENIPSHLKAKLEEGLECHIPISLFGPPGNEEAYLFTEGIDERKPLDGFYDVDLCLKSSWVDTVRDSLVDVDTIDSVKPK